VLTAVAAWINRTLGPEGGMVNDVVWVYGAGGDAMELTRFRRHLKVDAGPQERMSHGQIQLPRGVQT
jgi:hypothetical protein